MPRSLMLLAVAVVLTSIFVLTAEANPTTLTGTVTDEDTGSPLVGVTVTLAETADANANGFRDVLTATTDAQGQFLVTVPNGTDFWDVFLAKSAYESFGQEGVYSVNSPVTVGAFALKANPAYKITTVTVLEETTSTPIPGASLGMYLELAERLGVTDANGIAVFTLNSTSQEEMITATAASRVAATHRFHPAAQTAPYAFTMHLAAPSREILTGVLRDSAGTAIIPSRASLTFCPMGSGKAISAALRTGSEYKTYGLPNGTYTAVLESGARAYFQQVVVSPLTASPFDINFTELGAPTCSLTVTIKDPAGNTLNGVLLGIGRELQGQPSCELNTVRSSSSGVVTFANLPVGQYSVWCDHGTGQRDQVASVDLTSSTSINAVVRYQVNWSNSTTDAIGEADVSGVVKDAAGTGLPGVRLKIRQAGSRTVLGEATSGTGGNYTLTDFAPGDYEISAFALDSVGNPLLQVSGGVVVTISGSTSVTANDVVLYPQHVINVVVVNEARTAAISGVTVTVTQEGSNPPVTYTGTTNAIGGLSLGGIPLGNHQIRYEKAGYVTVDGHVEITPARNELVDGFCAVTAIVSLVAE